MKKLIISQNNEVKQTAIFDTEEGLQDFLQVLNSANTCWGQPERDLVDTEASPVSQELKDKAISVTEVQIAGQAYFSYKIPAEFEVEIVDVTNELQQKKINEQAEQYLKDTDWYILREVDEGTPCPIEIKQLRAEARAKIVR
jgi:hypothetical protein